MTVIMINGPCSDTHDLDSGQLLILTIAQSTYLTYDLKVFNPIQVKMKVDPIPKPKVMGEYTQTPHGHTHAHPRAHTHAH